METSPSFIPGRARLAVAGGHPGARLDGGVAHVGVHLGARLVVFADGVHHHVPASARRRASREFGNVQMASLFSNFGW